MTPASVSYISLLIFYVIPLLVLLIGVLLFAFEPKRRKLASSGLILLGCLEVSSKLILTRGAPIVIIYPVEVMTILLGIGLLYYAYRAR